MCTSWSVSFSSTDLRAYHPVKGKMCGKCDGSRKRGSLDEENECERLREYKREMNKGR